MSSRIFHPVLARACTALPSLLLFSSAHAAAAEQQLPPVVVSATRFEESLNQVPAHVRVISAEEIERSGAYSLPALFGQLGTVPVSGINLGQLGLGANVDLGGYGVTSGSTTLVLVDGQRLNPPDSTAIPWESIPLKSIERIEILQGGGSVQFGNGAVGGVVNIITRKGAKAGASVEQTVGRFNTLISNASLGRVVDDGQLSLHVSRSSTDGWRENSAAQASSARLRYSKDLARLDSVFVEAYLGESVSHMPGGVLGRAGEGNARAAKFNNVGSFNDTGNASLRAGLTRAITDAVKFEGELGYRRRSSDLTAPYYATADSVSQADGYVTGPVKSFLDGWEATFTPRIKIDLGERKSVIAGYDLSRSTQWSSNEFSPIAQQVILNNQGPFQYYGNIISDSQKAVLTNHSLYLTGRTPLSASVDMVAGMRRQWQDATTTDVNKSSANGTVNNQQAYAANAYALALNYRYSDTDRLYAKWDRSFRFANIDEFWGFDTNMNRIFSGALRPQNADTLEAGGDWRHGALSLAASVFRSVSKDEIRYDPQTFANNNSADDIRRTGLRWEVAYRWSPQLNLSAGGRLQQTEYASGPYAGNTVSLVPDKTLAVRVNYSVSDHASVGAVTSYTGSQFYDASPTISQTLGKLPAFWTTDLYARYQRGPWEMRMTLRNLVGDTYATYGGYGFVSLPGAGGGNRYYHYPSDPRALLVSLKYSF